MSVDTKALREKEAGYDELCDMVSEAADEIDTLRQQLVDDKVSHLTALGEKQMLIDQLRKERDEAINERDQNAAMMKALSMECDNINTLMISAGDRMMASIAERDEARAVARRYYVGMPAIGLIDGRFTLADDVVKSWPAPEES